MGQPAPAAFVACLLGLQIPVSSQSSGQAVLDRDLGAIRGTVIDSNTMEPLPGARVSCWLSGRQAEPYITSTDSNGLFQCSELQAGRYFVAADKTGYVSAAFGGSQLQRVPAPIDLDRGGDLSQVLLSLTRGGVVAGQVTDTQGNPVVDAEVSAAVYRGSTLVTAAVSHTDDLGMYRLWGLPAGSYHIIVRASQFNLSTSEGGVIPGTAFYPGVPTLESATGVHVAAGSETTNVDLTVTAARLSRIRGTVVDRLGQLTANVSVTIRRFDELTATYVEVARTRTNEKGAFQLSGLPPGQYEALAQMSSTNVPTQWAMAQFQPNDGDVEVHLSPSAVATVRGLIRAAGFVALPSRSIRVQISDDGISTKGPHRPARIWSSMPVQEDGTFTFPISPVTGVPRVIGLPVAWQVVAVKLNGREVTGQPINLGGASESTLEIIVSNELSQLTGVALDQEHQPVHGA